MTDPEPDYEQWALVPSPSESPSEIARKEALFNDGWEESQFFLTRDFVTDEVILEVAHIVRDEEGRARIYRAVVLGPAQARALLDFLKEHEKELADR